MGKRKPPSANITTGPVFGGYVSEAIFRTVQTGYEGSMVPGRWVGSTQAGAPTTGNYQLGDWVTTQDGHGFVCTVAGSPGTWTDLAAWVPQPPVGSVSAFAGSVAPTGWLTCDGSAVSRTTFSALFAVCGTTFGAGDGTTTFNLPNLTDRMAMGVGGAALGTAQSNVHDHTLSTTATVGNDSVNHTHSGVTTGSGATAGESVSHNHALGGSTDMSIDGKSVHFLRLNYIVKT